MGLLRLAQDLPGNYIIIGHNDEELYVVAELLLDNDALEIAKEMLEDDTMSVEDIGRFELIRHGEKSIEIKFTKPDETTLEVTVESDVLEDLIDQWELYMVEAPRHLTLVRRHDSDVIKLTHERVE